MCPVSSTVDYRSNECVLFHEALTIGVMSVSCFMKCRQSSNECVMFHEVSTIGVMSVSCFMKCRLSE